MTNLAVVNATGGTAYLKASGAGTDQDPHITEQTISGTVPVTGPLTDAELRASAVPVSGTVATTGGLTNAELRATPVPVSGTVQAAQSGDWNVGGTVSLSGTPTINAAQADAWNVGGTVNVGGVSLPTTLYSGLKAVTGAGTAEALAASQAILSGVTIKALGTNTGTVYVGPSGVGSANGFALAAGEQVFVEIDDVAKIYVDAAVSGEGVSWLAA